MSHFDPVDMSRKDRERWNNREPKVTVQDYCGVCDSLQYAVESRTSYSPFFKLTSCKACFDAERKSREEQLRSVGHWGLY